MHPLNTKLEDDMHEIGIWMEDMNVQECEVQDNFTIWSRMDEMKM